MKEYKSKIDVWLVVLMAIIFGFVGYSMFVSGVRPMETLTLFLPLFIVGYVVFTIKYTVEGKLLNIKNGILLNRNIDINSITSIKETNSWLSSPAASLDRIEIKYGKFSSIIISPKDKKAFIEDMLKINPEIEA